MSNTIVAKLNPEETAKVLYLLTKYPASGWPAGMHAWLPFYRQVRRKLVPPLGGLLSGDIQIDTENYTIRASWENMLEESEPRRCHECGSILEED